jgi:maltose alpha-D-glucosyltransferase/alpha-amylase
MHKALAMDAGSPAFRPEPVTQTDLDGWRAAAKREAKSAFTALRASLGRLEAPDRANAEHLLARREEIKARITSYVPPALDAMKTRVHGDYHLGQVLVVQQDFFIIDFEGEPRKTGAERRRKQLPLRDVAGMLRSFDYAAWAALPRVVQDHPQRRELLERQAFAWRDQAIAAFLEGYERGIAGSPSHPAQPEAAKQLLALFTLEKIFYELQYELASRPAWVGIPLHGAMTFLFPGALLGGHAE